MATITTEAQRNESEKKADTYRLTQSSKYIKFD